MRTWVHALRPPSGGRADRGSNLVDELCLLGGMPIEACGLFEDVVFASDPVAAAGLGFGVGMLTPSVPVRDPTGCRIGCVAMQSSGTSLEWSYSGEEEWHCRWTHSKQKVCYLNIDGDTGDSEFWHERVKGLRAERA